MQARLRAEIKSLRSTLEKDSLYAQLHQRAGELLQANRKDVHHHQQHHHQHQDVHGRRDQGESRAESAVGGSIAVGDGLLDSARLNPFAPEGQKLHELEALSLTNAHLVVELHRVTMVRSLITQLSHSLANAHPPFESFLVEASGHYGESTSSSTCTSSAW